MKKNPKQFLELQEEFFKVTQEKGCSSKLCQYVWLVLICMNKGYGFNAAHTLAYSIVGLQEANLAYHYPIVYWNCANLITDSGGEDSSVKYGKIAKAVGRMRQEGIVITPPYINRVRFGFKPDADKNEIIYGLKAVSGLGSKIAQAIIENQPYTSIDDFYNKMQQYKEESKENKFGNTAMVQLIKAGCFDELVNKPREEIMADFIRKISQPIQRLQMSNIEDLNRLGLLTKEQKQFELRLYRYKQFVFQKKNIARQDGKSPSTFFYKLDKKYAEPYFEENFKSELKPGVEYDVQDGFTIVKRGALEKVITKFCADFVDKVLTNEENLAIINQDRFQTIWDKYCSGNISKWEMDSLNYYYHDHELAHVNVKKYNIVDFNSLGVEPEIADHYYYRGQQKPRYNLVRICGTVIDKDKDHGIVTLLTPTGVVDVRFYKGQFGFYDRQISSVNEATGEKTVIESSWFKRGTKLLITGFRSEEQFIPRKYNNSIYLHSTQLIKEIDSDGNLVLQSERNGLNNEEGKAIGV